MHTVDVMARSANEAEQVAMEARVKGQPECMHYAPDMAIPIRNEDTDFDVVNARLRWKEFNDGKIA